MTKFRRWVFKFLTGFDLIEYQELLQLANRVNNNGTEVLQLTNSIRQENKEILEFNNKVLEHNKKVLDITNKTIEDCRSVLVLCQEMNANETTSMEG